MLLKTSECHRCGRPAQNPGDSDPKNERLTEFDTKRELACIQTFTESIEKTFIAGIEGIKGDFNYFENPSLVSLIEKDGYIYEFSLSGPETVAYPGALEIETYNQILSTFEFID